METVKKNMDINELDQEQYNYEPFADTEEYKKVNADCINSWVEVMKKKGVNSIGALLDVATGAGTMVQIVFDNLPESWKTAAVMCLDQSSEALKVAQSRLEKTVGKLKMVHSSIKEVAAIAGVSNSSIAGMSRSTKILMFCHAPIL